jgi:predicted small secreted protein
MYNPLLRLLLMLAAVLMLQLTLAGCNTISGMGQDIEAAGDAIEDQAEETKDY